MTIATCPPSVHAARRRPGRRTPFVRAACLALAAGAMLPVVSADESRPPALSAAEAAAQATDQAPSIEPTAAPPDRNALAAEIGRFAATEIGEPRVVEVAEGVFAALGFDVANVVVVTTDEGNVVIDTGSCTPRAEEIRRAMSAYAPGPVRAIVYTHGEIEQTGGGGVWSEEGVPIWGTHRLSEEFQRQFILLQPNELRRGIGQFGLSLADDRREASTLGRLPELEHLGGLPELRLPTHTFDETATFSVGGLRFELVAAPGATPDHLYVWIPHRGVLVVGDNFMRGFPELSSLRGTPHRSPDRWIASLDRMRAVAAEHLIASRHTPLSGQDEVETGLTDHRDAIQWIRDETLRGIRRGDSVENLAATIILPPHLADSPYLSPLTGSVAWAVRAVYGHYAGWFDEQVEQVSPLPPAELARRRIAMMGGVPAVLAAARQARQQGDAAWAVHLLSELRLACGTKDGDGPGAVAAESDSCEVRRELAAALESLAGSLSDSSARAYLISRAAELTRVAPRVGPWPCPTDETIRQIPLEAFFDLMAVRLKADRAADVHHVVGLKISDEQRQFTLSIRRGILEVVEGSPLPGTPSPVAAIATDGLTWRKLCMGVVTPTVEMLQGRVEIRGSRAAIARFVSYFDCSRDFKRASESPRTFAAGGGG